MKAKVVSIKTITTDKKLHLEISRKILNQNGNDCSDQQIIRIRDYLYLLTEIECRYFNESQATQADNVISINTQQHEAEESISLHPGEHRRTG